MLTHKQTCISCCICGIKGIVVVSSRAGPLGANSHPTLPPYYPHLAPFLPPVCSYALMLLCSYALMHRDNDRTRAADRSLERPSIPFGGAEVLRTFCLPVEKSCIITSTCLIASYLSQHFVCSISRFDPRR